MHHKQALTTLQASLIGAGLGGLAGGTLDYLSEDPSDKDTVLDGIIGGAMLGGVTGGVGHRLLSSPAFGGYRGPSPVKSDYEGTDEVIDRIRKDPKAYGPDGVDVSLSQVLPPEYKEKATQIAKDYRDRTPDGRNYAQSLADSAFDRGVKVRVAPNGADRIAGTYDPTTDSIKLSPANIDADTIQHELTHAAQFAGDESIRNLYDQAMTADAATVNLLRRLNLPRIDGGVTSLDPGEIDYLSRRGELEAYLAEMKRQYFNDTGRIPETVDQAQGVIRHRLQSHINKLRESGDANAQVPFLDSVLIQSGESGEVPRRLRQRLAEILMGVVSTNKDIEMAGKTAKDNKRCWKGYKPVPGKKPYSEDSCEKVAILDGAIGAGIGAMLAPKGHRMEGAGRGAAYARGGHVGASAGGAVGAGAGVLGGTLTAALLTTIAQAARGEPLSTKRVGQGLIIGAAAGGGLGGLVGAYRGGRRGVRETRERLGEPSYAKSDGENAEKTAIVTLGLDVAATGAATAARQPKGQRADGFTRGMGYGLGANAGLALGGGAGALGGIVAGKKGGELLTALLSRIGQRNGYDTGRLKNLGATLGMLGGGLLGGGAGGGLGYLYGGDLGSKLMPQFQQDAQAGGEDKEADKQAASKATLARGAEHLLLDKESRIMHSVPLAVRKLAGRK